MTTGLVNDWQAKVKRVFVLPLVAVNIGFMVIGAVAGWWGPVLGGASIFVLFGMVTAQRLRRVPAWPSVTVALLGVVLGVFESAWSAVLAVAALAFLALYVVWYSRNGRTASEALAVGAEFPEVDFLALDGSRVHSASWRGSSTIVLFYRGSWCPLCNVQVKELAADYREIEARGAKVVLVSPQPAEESRKLAAKFDAPMTFLVDEDNATARKLGIQHPGGAPVGIAKNGETVLPTAVVLDAEGVIVFADETDNYRLRPDPAEFLRVLATRDSPSR